MAAEPGQIFSFYSFKGGVGRSMALANVAAMLARAGNSVLVVDWDLEAPGLQKYFNRFDGRIDDQVSNNPGIVDLLSDLQRGGQPDWRDTVINISLQVKSGTVDFDFISAGRAGPDYSDRLQKINWQELYDKRHLGEFLERLRNEWKQKYTYVLLDSRTGVTDIGDVCTVLLPDTLVAFFVTNEQNLDGVQYIIDRAHLVTQKLPTDRGKLVTVPILARDEVYNEYKRAQEWRQRSAQKFAPVLTDWLPQSVSAGSYFQKMFIPYVTHWSFGESLPVIENEDEIENPASISAAYSRLATLMKAGLDWSVVAAGENPMEVDTLKAQKTKLEQSISMQRLWVRGAVGSAIVLMLATGGFVVYQARNASIETRKETESVINRDAVKKLVEEVGRREDETIKQRAALMQQQQRKETEQALQQAARQAYELKSALAAVETRAADTAAR
jgi:cellulose biosynthesis protein BcsQ